MNALEKGWVSFDRYRLPGWLGVVRLNSERRSYCWYIVIKSLLHRCTTYIIGQHDNGVFLQNMRMFDDVWVLEASWSSRTIQQLTPLHILSLSIMTTWWHSSRPKEWCRPLRLSWTSQRVPSPATKIEWIRESHRFDSFKRKEQHNCCLLHTTWPSFRIHIPGPMAWKLSGKSRRFDPKITCFILFLYLGGNSVENHEPPDLGTIFRPQKIAAKKSQEILSFFTDNHPILSKFGINYFGLYMWFLIQSQIEMGCLRTICNWLIWFGGFECHVSSLTSSASIQNHITSSCGTLSTIVAERKVIRPCVEIMKNRWVVLSANEFPIEHLHAAILKEETAAFLQCFHTEAIHNSCQLHNLRRKNGQPVSRQGAARCEFVKPWWTLGLMLCTVRKVYCDNIWQYSLYSIIFY